MAKDWELHAEAFQAAGIPFEAIDLWPFLSSTSAASFDSFVEEFYHRYPIHKSNSGGKNVLLGYSLGGRLALHLFEKHPEYWDQVVLVSAHPGLVHEKEKYQRLAHDEIWANKIDSLTWSEFLAEWNQQSVLISNLNRPNTSEGSALPNRLALESQKTEIKTSFSAWSLGKQKDFRSFLSTQKTKVHWAVGNNDAKFVKIAQEITAINPAIKLTVFNHAGHRIPWEQPQAFIQWVTEIYSQPRPDSLN